MGIDTVGSLARQVLRPPPGTEEPPRDLCPLEGLARVLAVLLPVAVTADQLRGKAVGLGLLRLSPAEEGTELTVLTASRLLLAGYRLPAQVEPLTWTQARGHCRKGRLVFLFLDPPAVLRVHDVRGKEPDGPWLLVSEPEAGPDGAERRPLSRLAPAWAAAGNLALVAARRWDDLPREGRGFFAGTRSPAAEYYWNSAECETDGEGNILRF